MEIAVLFLRFIESIQFYKNTEKDFHRLKETVQQALTAPYSISILSKETNTTISSD